MKGKKTEDCLPGVIWAFGVGIVGSAVVLLFYISHFHRQDFSANLEDWGSFGDYVGGLLNPIVAFCALILLAASLRMQARELANPLKEFKQATDIMQRQNFEANLWQLVRLHHEFANGFVLSTATNTQVSGRACFGVFRSRLADLCERSPCDVDSPAWGNLGSSI